LYWKKIYSELPASTGLCDALDVRDKDQHCGERYLQTIEHISKTMNIVEKEKNGTKNKSRLVYTLGVSIITLQLC
jgi:hypothetical protein